MKTIREVMTADVVWISPSARVIVAVNLMKGRDIGALPVVDTGERVVGLVTLQGVLGERNDTAVSDVMLRDFLAMDPETPVRDASEEMARTGATHVVVMEDDKLVGIVSRSDLLPELGRNFDPLTNLPWQDAFREWAMAALKRHSEISVIFIDINNFGAFNKKYGHVIGDTVICGVADVIKHGTDPERELACRYAGDEFAIVSLRRHEEAQALADDIKRQVSELHIEGLPDGSVGATYGLSGGRRTREREDMHYAATIDDLVTRASKDCTAHKPGAVAQKAPEPEAAPAPPPAEPAAPAAPRPEPARAPSPPLGTPAQPDAEARTSPRLKIGTVTISTSDAHASATVQLARKDREFAGEARGYTAGGRNVLRLVAEAAASAASRSMAEGHAVIVDEVVLNDLGTEDEVVTVTVMFIAPRWSARQVGSAVVRRGDHYRATAAAIMAAVNRLIESAPESAPDGLDDVWAQ